MNDEKTRELTELLRRIVSLQRFAEDLGKTGPASGLDRGVRERLRETAQILIEGIGADGPMDAEEAAKKAVERIRYLEDAIRRAKDKLVDAMTWLKEGKPLGQAILQNSATAYGILKEVVGDKDNEVDDE